MHSEIELRREVEAIQIPSGDTVMLPAGTRVIITQSLGGSYTIATDQGLARISSKNADALGIEKDAGGDAVHDCAVVPAEERTVIEVKMTLTAPGCGMGPTIAADAQGKIMALPGVDEARVELVWDPPWNQGMISEAGRMQLGMV